ncbi:uncharacterized protein PSFLO_05882 [Pseudozyma flocculosa]|uniref:Uncharacterized protein n=1 Tax=Pseudozyma flocculosa TaxID=84751 RepID=A0A5C3F847_9BASI|nr:uncharacterized protein PSFLO_05882 [Pseudozyma flocculosa]
MQPPAFLPCLLALPLTNAVATPPHIDSPWLALQLALHSACYTLLPVPALPPPSLTHVIAITLPWPTTALLCSPYLPAGTALV